MILRIMLSIFLGIALVAIGHSEQASRDGFIYDEQGREGAEVFNTKRLWFSIQNGRMADVRSSSEFAAAFQWCSDQQFYCMTGGPLNVIVPKAFADGTWVHAGIRCSTRRSSSSGLAGDCISPGNVRTRYVFERGRGLISYQRAVDSRRYVSRRYVLRGSKGLFSSIDH